jgi:hypothetical protein
MRIMKIKLFFLFLFNIFQMIGQELPPSIEQCIEYMTEVSQTENLDYSSLVDALVYYKEVPLDLNKANYDDLHQFLFLTEFQIQELLNHRVDFGKLISLLELQTLPSWDMNLIQLIRPFVTLDDRLSQTQLSLKMVLKYGKGEVWTRYQRCLTPKKGFDSELSTNPYLGAKGSYFSKVKYSYRNNLSFCLLGQNDAGERFFQGKGSNGFDFYAGHLFYQGGKYLKAIALGDYQVQLGQGLNLWLGHAMSKSSEVMMVKKNPIGIKPYQSIDEQRFLRGTALLFGLENWRLLLFASEKRIDATGVNEEKTQFTSLKLDGFHRTENEIAGKEQVKKTIIGSSIQFSKRNFALGIQSVFQGFSMNYQKQMKPYNQFDFSGRSLVSSSIDYRYTYKNGLVFGELAHSSFSNGFAQLHGLLVALTPYASVSLVYRDYQRNYETLYNSGFSEGSATKNEKGLFTGLILKLNTLWSLNSYLDIFHFPWMKYLVDAPSNGYEYLIQSTFKPNKKIELYGRYRLQVREKNSRDSDHSLTELEAVFQRNFRLNLTVQISDALRFRSRVELVTVNRESNIPEKGILVYQDFSYKPKMGPVDFSFRYALFETDSYDSRLYAYESNALYVFSIPAYYYTGSKIYGLLRWTCFEKVDIWFKFGTTIFHNKKSLGSGNEEILGNRKTELTIQFRWEF